MVDFYASAKISGRPNACRLLVYGFTRSAKVYMILPEASRHTAGAAVKPLLKDDRRYSIII